MSPLGTAERGPQRVDDLLAECDHVVLLGEASLDVELGELGLAAGVTVLWVNAAGRARIADRLEVIRSEIADCGTLHNALSERRGHRKTTLAGYDRANAPSSTKLTALTTFGDPWPAAGTY